MRFPSPGMEATKSSPEAVFRLTLVTFAGSPDGLDEELLSPVVEEVGVGVADAQADSTTTPINTSETKVDFRYILFSNS